MYVDCFTSNKNDMLGDLFHYIHEEPNGILLAVIEAMSEVSLDPLADWDQLCGHLGAPECNQDLAVVWSGDA